MLLHLSDVHVTDPAAPIARFASGEERLAMVVDHLIEAAVPLDAVVLTGDLVDHGTAEEYARLRAQLDRLPCAWYPLPGNHDVRATLHAALLEDAPWAPPPDGPCNYDVGLGAADDTMRLVMVDSSQPDHHDGRWTASTLEWLDATLSSSTVRTLVATHHPPVSTGLWHMDYGGGHGGAALGDVISRHPHVEAVVCGHVHRRLVIGWAGTLLSCAPSLTFQSEALLGNGDPVIHAALPDLPLYRWIDGRFTIDSLDWHPGRARVPMPAVLGNGWAAYEAAARSGTLPRGATGH